MVAPGPSPPTKPAFFARRVHLLAPRAGLTNSRIFNALKWLTYVKVAFVSKKLFGALANRQAAQFNQTNQIARRWERKARHTFARGPGREG